MVSINRVHVIGSWYMSHHGGFKPKPDAFISYFQEHDFKPKRVFFMGNRMVDLKLATKIKQKLKCKVFKCLILRDGDDSVSKSYADIIVKNLWQVRNEIRKFKPDLVMSDFDNTLVHAGYNKVEGIVERTRFWERFQNPILNRLHSYLGLLTIPFLRKKPYIAKYDNTEGFLRTLKPTLLIHTMSPELVVKSTLDKILNS